MNRFYNSGTLLCLGGRNDGPALCNTIEAYIPHLNKWIPYCELPFSVGRQVGAVVLGESMFILGGRGNQSPCGMFDLNTREYQPCPQMPMPRKGCAIVSYANRYIYAIGGTDAGRDAAFAVSL